MRYYFNNIFRRYKITSAYCRKCFGSSTIASEARGEAPRYSDALLRVSFTTFAINSSSLGSTTSCKTVSLYCAICCSGEYFWNIAQNIFLRFIVLIRKNAYFLFHGWIANFNFKNKTIQLRLRQAVSSFLVYRVLCGQYHKRWFHRVSDAIHCYLSFFHYFKQCRLCFGRRPVDLIYQNDIAENRPLKSKRILLD